MVECLKKHVLISSSSSFFQTLSFLLLSFFSLSSLLLSTFRLLSKIIIISDELSCTPHSKTVKRNTRRHWEEEIQDIPTTGMISVSWNLTQEIYLRLEECLEREREDERKERDERGRKKKVGTRNGSFDNCTHLMVNDKSSLFLLSFLPSFASLLLFLFFFFPLFFPLSSFYPTTRTSQPTFVAALWQVRMRVREWGKERERKPRNGRKKGRKSISLTLRFDLVREKEWKNERIRERERERKNKSEKERERKGERRNESGKWPPNHCKSDENGFKMLDFSPLSLPLSPSLHFLHSLSFATTFSGYIPSLNTYFYQLLWIRGIQDSVECEQTWFERHFSYRETNTRESSCTGFSISSFVPPFIPYGESWWFFQPIFCLIHFFFHFSLISLSFSLISLIFFFFLIHSFWLVLYSVDSFRFNWWWYTWCWWHMITFWGICHSYSPLSFSLSVWFWWFRILFPLFFPFVGLSVHSLFFIYYFITHIYWTFLYCNENGITTKRITTKNEERFLLSSFHKNCDHYTQNDHFFEWSPFSWYYFLLFIFGSNLCLTVAMEERE